MDQLIFAALLGFLENQPLHHYMVAQCFAIDRLLHHVMSTPDHEMVLNPVVDPDSCNQLLLHLNLINLFLNQVPSVSIWRISDATKEKQIH